MIFARKLLAGTRNTDINFTGLKYVIKWPTKFLKAIVKHKMFLLLLIIEIRQFMFLTQSVPKVETGL